MDELRPEVRRRTVSGGPLDGKPFAVSGYGEHDQVEPPRVLVENLLPHIPTATMMTIPDVGHLIPVESPAELAAAIASHPSPAR